jgi:hypothetical protein
VNKTQTPLLPIILAAVVVGLCSIPVHGLVQTFVVVLGSIAVGAYGRQRGLTERDRAPF